jgi:hypothetical protein
MASWAGAVKISDYLRILVVFASLVVYVRYCG